MNGHYLVGDVGATNACFTLLGDLSTWPTDAPVASLFTTEYPAPEALVDAARAALGFSNLQGACIAAAGPVYGGRVHMINAGLVLDAQALEQQLGCPVTLVNDFAALAQGVPWLREIRQIGGKTESQGVRAVLGPGSGFGVSALIPSHPQPLVLPSEGGHADLAPGGPLEHEILRVLSRDHPVVSWETVLSGPGLVNLYRAMAVVWGAVPQEATPEWISEQACLTGDPICHQTLETFFGFLGGAAGNLALIFGATGGIYIGGGIVPALVEFAEASPLRRRFEERGDYADIVAEIPILIILDAYPGLLGARECLRIATQDRWGK